MCVFIRPWGKYQTCGLQTPGQWRRAWGTTSVSALFCCPKVSPEEAPEAQKKTATSVNLQRLNIQCHQLQAGNELSASAWDICQERNGRRGQKHRWKLWRKPPWEHVLEIMSNSQQSFILWSSSTSWRDRRSRRKQEEGWRWREKEKQKTSSLLIERERERPRESLFFNDFIDHLTKCTVR